MDISESISFLVEGERECLAALLELRAWLDREYARRLRHGRGLPMRLSRLSWMVADGIEAEKRFLGAAVGLQAFLLAFGWEGGEN